MHSGAGQLFDRLTKTPQGRAGGAVFIKIGMREFKVTFMKYSQSMVLPHVTPEDVGSTGLSAILHYKMLLRIFWKDIHGPW